MEVPTGAYSDTFYTLIRHTSEEQRRWLAVEFARSRRTAGLEIQGRKALARKENKMRETSKE